MNQIFQKLQAEVVVGISELKRNPSAVMKEAEHHAVAVLNHNRVVGYVVSPAIWDHVQETFTDLRLIEEAELDEGEDVEVSIHDLSSDI